MSTQKEETITLFNPPGAGRIEYRKGVFFKPNTSVAFPLAEGLKLKRIYQDQLKTLDDFKANYIPENAPSITPFIELKKAEYSEEKKIQGKRGRPPKTSEFEKSTDTPTQVDIEDLM